MIKSICLCVLLLVSCSLMAQTEADIIKVGDKMPVFSFQTESGSVSSNTLKGKVVMINFFATWCPPCRKELPHVQEKVWDKYKDHPDFKLMIIGREHTVDEVKKFASDKYSMPFFPDVNRKIFALFADNTIPRNYIINRKGEVVYAASGFSDESFDELLMVLAKLLD